MLTSSSRPDSAASRAWRAPASALLPAISARVKKVKPAVIRASNGFGSIDSDAQAEAARRDVIEREGLNLSIEGALCYAAYRADVAAGRVRPGDHVVLFNTATGLKSPMPEAATTALDASAPIDYGAWS